MKIILNICLVAVIPILTSCGAITNGISTIDSQSKIVIVNSPIIKQIPLVNFDSGENISFQVLDSSGNPNTSLAASVFTIKPYLDSQCLQNATGTLTYTLNKSKTQYIASSISYSELSDFYFEVSSGTVSFCMKDSPVHMVSGNSNHIVAVTAMPLNKRAGAAITVSFRILDTNGNPVQNDYIQSGNTKSSLSDASGLINLDIQTPHVTGNFTSGNSSINLSVYSLDYTVTQVYNLPILIIPNTPSVMNYTYSTMDLSLHTNTQSQMFYSMLTDGYGNPISPGSYVYDVTTWTDSHCQNLSNDQFSTTNLSLDAQNLNRSQGYDATKISMAIAGTYYVTFSFGTIDSQCLGPIVVSP
jgi:hypothetical protein